MRYLSIFLLSPSLAYAACAPGVNYGSLDISTPSPVCIAYSGSTLGGCSAYCGGGGGGTVCVELPAATPPIKGPYFSDGNECTLSGGGDGGGDNGGGDNGGGDNGGGDNGGGDPFMHRSPPLWVYDGGSVNLAHGFDAVSTNIERFKNSYESTEYAKRYELKFIAKDIAKIAQNTTGMNGGVGSYGSLFFEMTAHLKSLSEKSVFEPNFWNDKDIARTKQLSDMRQDISYLGGELQYITDILRSGGGSSGGGSGGGELAAIQAMMQSNMSTMGSISGNTRSMDSNLRNMSGKLGSIDSTLSTMNSTNSSQLGDMQGSLAAIKGMTQQALQSGWGNSGGGQGGDGGDGDGDGGDGGEGGDKPCTGPLCTFSPSGSVPGNGLSDVFGEVAIAGVKQQVTDKQVEIQAQMDEIKGVFSPGKLEVSGNYENDYHDINGARVDLSGKSNIELFFSSGPAQVIWFLAVLIAFGILLGGRRDA
ncbi:hypothetical protein ACFWHB_10790 [Aeromonas mytilicola subsp. aquatica]|uniref:hypothetical protein n=1 Tax=Aeromonas mytilicola TaxID=3377113 RepID=UPI0037C15233